jgi:aspartyl-tRNA(Asn)/glutamyl-tRNA(Gln) amidotransferase subunit B
MNKYTTIIGMEVHVELATKSKMFCSCKNDPELLEPNINICEICLAHPGTLPVPNEQAIKYVVAIGKALNCDIREISKFDRKHYFYPDLPKGYQISQYDEPIAEGGSIRLTFPLENNDRSEVTIGIERAHLEEDTAKLTHDSSGNTLVDFNRAGTPLVEIVTRPDFASAVEAKVYCQELRLIMRALGVSAADMEKGHMRCEANISVQETGRFEIVGAVVKPIGTYILNNKVEVKNINSFKAVEKAIDYEIARQIEMLENDIEWPQQTRGWDDPSGETVLQREKENAADYRYFPDPDIPPFHPRTFESEITTPELPIAKRERFREEYGFSHDDARILTQDSSWSDFTENVMSETVNWLHNYPEVREATDDILNSHKSKLARLAGGWLTNKLGGLLSSSGKSITDISFTPENFAELITLIHTNRLNATNALKILTEMVTADKDIDPTHIMEERGYGQITDSAALESVVMRVIENYPVQVGQFRNGKDPIIKFLIGMCMKDTEGGADPNVVESILREKLS